MNGSGSIQDRPLTAWRLIGRTLVYHWRSHLCLALAVAACTAVIAGALAVGDSMRYTLRSLADQRIGQVRQALFSGGRLFRQELAEVTGTVPVLRLPGIVTQSDGARRVNGVQVLGVDSRFAGLALAPGFPELTDGTVALSVALARRLGVQVGDEVLVRVAKAVMTGELALNPKGETSRAFRAQVQAIVRDDQMGRFTLENTQVPPLNVYVALSVVQALLDSQSRINLLLAGPEVGASPQQLNGRLEKAWSLPDRGLALVDLPGQAGIELRSEDIFLPPDVERAALRVSGQAVGVLSYLVNSLSAGDKATPYSFVAGLDPLLPGMSVAPDEVVITDWLAADLAVTNGADITLRFFVLGPLRTLVETSAVFRVGGVVPLKDYADPTLMPELSGLSESASCRDWESGLPIDLTRIRPKDEAYWETWRGAPKAFVHLEKAQSLWGNRWGNLTAVRYPPSTGGRVELEARLTALLNAADRPAFKPVRDEARRSWNQALDFGQLFIGLSFFLVVSTICLMALLFRLAAGQQGEQTGILLALGIDRQRVQSWMMAGNALAAVFGCVSGLPLGLVYAKGLLWGFESLWQPAGTLHLMFKVNVVSLALAGTVAIMLALVSAWSMFRRFRGTSICSMLEGQEDEDSGWRRRGGSRRFTVRADLARRNAGRHPGRSVLISGMVACAVFLLVVVVMFQPHERDPRARESGTGGFALMVETSVPIGADLKRPEGLKAYGITAADMAGTGVVGLRVRPGDDAGCGNLGRAQEPRLLGVAPAAFRKRGSFSFLKTAAKGLAALPVKNGDSPWSMLEAELEPDVIPAFADENTLMWGLGKSLGDELTYVDERGQSFRVRFVGLLKNSILQGGVIISEQAMLARYPSLAGQSLFLIDVPEESERRVADLLGRQLRDEGAEVTLCAQRLAEGGALTVMYLKLFQALGGLGLLLGVGVVALVVVRNAWDRQGELALLRAVGFSRRNVAGLLVGEQVWLVGWGMAAGVLMALAVVAFVLDASRLLSAWWPGPLIMLVMVAMGGVLSSALAAWAVTGSTPWNALRRE